MSNNRDTLNQSYEYEMPNPMALADLMAQDFPPEQWLAAGLIPAGAITMLSGDGGAYKSYILLHLAACLSTGQLFLNHFEVQKTAVLIVDEENGPALLQKRLRTMLDDSTGSIYNICDSGFVFNDNAVDKLIVFAKSKEIGVIIFDSYVRMLGNADENSSRDTAQIFKSIRRIREAGIATIIIHHNRKQSDRNFGVAQNMRGSSDLRNAPDYHIGISSKGQEIQIEQSKARATKPLPKFTVKVVEIVGGVQFHYEGDVMELPSKASTLPLIIKEVLSNLDMPPNKTELYGLLKAQTSVGKSTMQTVLNEMIKHGEVLTRIGGQKNSMVCYLPGQETDNANPIATSD